MKSQSHFLAASYWRVLICLLAAFPIRGLCEEGSWRKVSAADIAVYERSHAGSALHEFKAVGTIDAGLDVVKRVLEDVERYPEFMPYVTEAKTLSSTGNSRVSYQRISPPIVGDRDYTILVKTESRVDKSGSATTSFRWKAANHLGPAEKPRVSRVKLTEGYWLLEKAADGQKTQVTYGVISDGGGGLPAVLTNWASKTAIPQLYRAIRKQAALQPRVLGG